ncbi:MAG: GNAT family N-acetyltransferase [Candidatus Hodarchaeota archaeon]
MKRKRSILQFMGQDYSYHLGILTHTGYEKAVARHVSSCISQNETMWDIINLVHLDEGEIFIDYIKDLSMENNCVYLQQKYDSSELIELPKTFETYLSTLTKNARQNIKKNIKKLERDFQVQFETKTDLISLKKYWPIFLTLHRENVHSKARTTILDDEDFAEFYFRISANYAKHEKLRLNLLSLDGHVMAIHLGLQHNETVYSLNMGKSVNLHPTYGLWTVLLSLSIKESIEKQAKFYDLLGGGGDYKKKFGARECGGTLIKIYRSQKDYWFDKIIEKLKTELVKYKFSSFINRSFL